MKAKKKYKWLIISMVMPFVFWCCPDALERWEYATSDGIGQSDIDTRRILRRYESTNDATQIHNWLSSNRDGALGTQMCLTSSRWAVEHKNGFVKIIQTLPSQEQTRFIDLFCGAINQSSPGEFEDAFKNYPSPIVQEIIKMLAENRPLPWPTPTSQR